MKLDDKTRLARGVGKSKKILERQKLKKFVKKKGDDIIKIK